jgi:hypothetical protein
MYLLDESTGQTVDLCSASDDFGPDTYNWGWDRTAKHELVLEHLQPDGSLMIVCDIDFFLPTDLRGEDSSGETSLSEGSLKRNCRNAIEKLLSTGANSDCTIVVG